MFIAASAVGALDNPFYAALDKLLGKNGFDEFVETCGEFYADRMGRPGLPPGVYFWIVMRRRFGFGTPRGLQGLASAVAALAGAFSASWAQSAPPCGLKPPFAQEHLARAPLAVCTTGSLVGHFFHRLLVSRHTETL